MAREEREREREVTNAGRIISIGISESINKKERCDQCAENCKTKKWDIRVKINDKWNEINKIVLHL